MPALMRRLNYRHIILGETSEHETIGVLTQDGEYRYLPWRGFIRVEDARLLAQARPVKLNAMAISGSDGLGGWQQLKDQQHVQGCLVGDGVYAVLVEGMPRVL